MDEARSSGPLVNGGAPGPAGRLGQAIAGAFGSGTRSRFMMRLWLVSVGAHAVAALLLAFAVQGGMSSIEATLPLALLMILGQAGFYAWVRIAHDKLPSDDALFGVQAALGTLCCAWGYAIVGPMRACALLLVTLTLAFSMFARSPRTQRRLALAVLAVFGIAMAVMSELAPERYPAQVEAMHFLALAAVAYAVVLLGAQLNRLRERSDRQKTELSVALQRIQLLATRDDLTGLMNRRCIQDVMTLEHQRCMRSGQPFCLAVLDLDHFKLINDAHGHATGDNVLRAFAREATATIRVSDVLARWGGEEFLLLMSDTRGPLARQAVERLRERVAALRVAAEDRLLQITVSVGVVEHRAGEPLEETIERADRALYAAKAEGRNRVASR